MSREQCHDSVVVDEQTAFPLLEEDGVLAVPFKMVELPLLAPEGVCAATLTMLVLTPRGGGAL